MEEVAIAVASRLPEEDADRRAGAGNAGVRVPDDLGATDHLLELIDPAVEKSDLLFRLFVLRVVLDVARLKRLLQALTGFGAAAQGDLEISLELLESLRGQQNRFG